MVGKKKKHNLPPTLAAVKGGYEITAVKDLL